MLVSRLAASLQALGFVPAGPVEGAPASGILAMTHPSADLPRIVRALQERRATISLRHDRAGTAYLRFSPHFYNTEDELERLVTMLREVM